MIKIQEKQIKENFKLNNNFIPKTNNYKINLNKVKIKIIFMEAKIINYL